MIKSTGINVLNHLSELYESICHPLRLKAGLQQTAFDILMFLADYPDYCTVNDISRHIALKPNIVSINVDKLVNGGYLLREPIPDDRRKTRLVRTEKANLLTERGREMRQGLISAVTEGMDVADKDRLGNYLSIIRNNIVKLKSKQKKTGDSRRKTAKKGKTASTA